MRVLLVEYYIILTSAMSTLYKPKHGMRGTKAESVHNLISFYCVICFISLILKIEGGGNPLLNTAMFLCILSFACER